MRGSARRPEEVAEREPCARSGRDPGVEFADQPGGDRLDRGTNRLKVDDGARCVHLRQSSATILRIAEVRPEEPAIAQQRERRVDADAGEPAAVIVRRQRRSVAPAEAGKVRLGIAAADVGEELGNTSQPSWPRPPTSTLSFIVPVPPVAGSKYPPVTLPKSKSPSTPATMWSLSCVIVANVACCQPALAALRRGRKQRRPRGVLHRRISVEYRQNRCPAPR